MDPRRSALYMSRARAGIGLVLIFAPRFAAWAWLGPHATGPAARVFARTTGVRDFALGVGAAIALAERSGGAGWLSMGAVADAVDGVVSLATPELSWRARVTGVVAAGSAVAHMAAARTIGREEAGADI